VTKLTVIFFSYFEDLGLLLFVAVLHELHDEEDGVARLHQVDQVILELVVKRISVKEGEVFNGNCKSEKLSVSK